MPTRGHLESSLCHCFQESYCQLCATPPSKIPTKLFRGNIAYITLQGRMTSGKQNISRMLYATKQLYSMLLSQNLCTQNSKSNTRWNILPRFGGLTDLVARQSAPFWWLDGTLLPSNRSRGGHVEQIRPFLTV